MPSDAPRAGDGFLDGGVLDPGIAFLYGLFRAEDFGQDP